MWIDKEYYNELLKTLQLFSQGAFSFDESELERYHQNKYQQLTQALVDVRTSSNKNVKNCLNMMNNIVEGKCIKLPEELDENSDYKVIYDRYEVLIDSLKQINSSVNNLKVIISNGNLNSTIDLKGLEGIWLENINNVNDIVKYFLKYKKEFISVIHNVAQGDLNHKITIDAKGEMLELKNTINMMVDQLGSTTAELMKITQKVGIDGQFGVQVKLDEAAGIWLELMNNVNFMSMRLAEVNRNNQNRIWIKEGLSVLSQEIFHEDFIEEQFQTTIIHLCRYIKASMGSIYIYDAEKDILHLEASYASPTNIKLIESYQIGEGLIGQVAYDRKPVLLELDASQCTVDIGTASYPLVSTYLTPIVFKNNLVGVIELSSHHHFTELELEYVERALTIIAGSFYAAIIQYNTHKQLEMNSYTDALTGLYNRGYFDSILANVVNTKKRNDGLLCFAMIDIDYFKDFNDQYGHQIGDEVLKNVSRVLLENLKREGDLCFRIGGEEFAVIFSASSSQKALKFMDSIRKKISQVSLKNEKFESINNITISMGLMCQRASKIKDEKMLFEETDALLYQAKESGRNRIIQNR